METGAGMINKIQNIIDLTQDADVDEGEVVTFACTITQVTQKLASVINPTTDNPDVGYDNMISVMRSVLAACGLERKEEDMKKMLDGVKSAALALPGADSVAQQV